RPRRAPAARAPAGHAPPPGRSPQSEKHVDDELVEGFVVIPALGEAVEVGGLALERLGLAGAVAAALGQLRRRRGRQRLDDLWELVEAARPLSQRGIGAHAA